MKRLIAVLMLAVMLIGLLAGCNATTNTPGGAGKNNFTVPAGALLLTK